MALEDRIRGLQLEDRVHASVEEVLGELRTRVENDLHHMVDQLVKAAAEEREEAIVTARRAAFDEGSQDGVRQAADAEARINEIVRAGGRRGSRAGTPDLRAAACGRSRGCRSGRRAGRPSSPEAPLSDVFSPASGPSTAPPL